MGAGDAATRRSPAAHSDPLYTLYTFYTAFPKKESILRTIESEVF